MDSNWFHEQKIRVLEATDYGLKIFERFFQGIPTTVNGNKGTKQFKSPLRPGPTEKTASAVLFKRQSDGQWGIKDFGESGHESFISAIDAYMKLNHISQNDVSNAILELSMSFDVELPGKSAPVLKAPKIDSVLVDSMESWSYQPTEWTSTHMFVFNPKANAPTDEGANLYNAIINAAARKGLVPVKSFSYCKPAAEDGTFKLDEPKQFKKITYTATDVFPIFLYVRGLTESEEKQLQKHIEREEFEKAAILQSKKWAKVYMPYSDPDKSGKNKGARFMHLGTKPDNYIFGLDELKDYFDSEKSKLLEKLEDTNPKEYERQKKEFKLDHIIITTGGSDGINVDAMGYYTVYSNSESAFITPKQYNELKKYAHIVYYVGDMDDAGRKAARTLGLMYSEIRIIRLPKELSNNTGWRNKKAKDVKDFCKYYKPSDFYGLMTLATPFQFWNYEKTTRGLSLQYIPFWAAMFLNEHGFRKFRSNNSKMGFEVVRVNGNIVTKCEPDDVKSFLTTYCIQKCCKYEIINLVMRTKAIREELVRDLEWFEGTFKRGTKDTQYWFFEHETWKIQADKVEFLKPGTLDVYSWADKIYKITDYPNVHVKHSDKKHFNIQNIDGRYVVTDVNYDNDWIQFFVNTSKTKWKEEFTNAAIPLDANQELVKKHQCHTINGIHLTEEQQYDQILHFLSKITSIGYILHTYKQSSRAWAPWHTEDNERDTKDANGRSGKSLMLKYIYQMFLNSVWKDGRNIDEKYNFGKIDSTTELLIVADAEKDTDLNKYFNIITDGLENRALYSLGDSIPFEDAPKVLFQSNFMPWGMTDSLMDRLWIIGFSDYYHGVGGEHITKRNPAEDMGRELYTDWTPVQWMEFFNIMCQCLQAYLKFGRIDPPMYNIKRQIAKVNMGNNFEAFGREFIDRFVNQGVNPATVTMKEATNHKFLPVKLLMYEYLKYAKNVRTKETLSQGVVLKKLSAYCAYAGFTMNPTGLLNRSGRLQKKYSESVLRFLADIDPTKTIENKPASTHLYKVIWAPEVVFESDKVDDMIWIGTPARFIENTEPSEPMAMVEDNDIF